MEFINNEEKTSNGKNFKNTNLNYYQLLSKQYPGIKSVCTEIINLEAILNLPKGTEHFMSDIHGEYEAFKHIINNCSGVIKEKVKQIFESKLSKSEIEDLVTLIYYPKEKLKKIGIEKGNNEEWYIKNIQNLIIIAKKLSLKYTRSKVRKALSKEYAYIIEELINERDHDSTCQKQYHKQIIKTIISIDNGDDFIVMITELIKRLAVDKLHIIGDVFDRGPGSDKVIDLLMQHHNVDIQWGNHDILWMGAACGNEACMAIVIKNCLSYNNVNILENGYGISLRSFERYARKRYPNLKRKEAMIQCISIIVLKLEGGLIMRHPEYEMNNQLLLNNIKNNSLILNNKVYKTKHLEETDCSYNLTREEKLIVEKMKNDFINSEKLKRHTRFLYNKGSTYHCCNNNLLFHGCVPMDTGGEFSGITVKNCFYSGKSLLDYCDKQARRAFFINDIEAIDFMFYLWSGYNSPLSGRQLKTFERTLIDNKDSWIEPMNDYFYYYNDELICNKILEEFGLDSKDGHIINGHTPVKINEQPLKANGKVIVIDGGFCQRYHRETGIAGYTLIFSSHGLQIKAHKPFEGIDRVLCNNNDINSTSHNIVTFKSRKLVKDTDIGVDVYESIEHLKVLLSIYKKGLISIEYEQLKK